ncbi:PadR family transcriptional regulator [Paludisphaera soli]|uniref:PadR family transcriptional regulator n=1 Tax=Paludisphaera soli TaxID=2712865 RepID=UPI0013ED321C|nr:PadR family transcriptional regulator [Paludisphaera soli]
MSSWETQLRKGLVELAVLATMDGGEAYGYGIVERLRKIEGLEFTESTVYPVLARLAREGFLAIRAEPSPAGPTRRYYRLTPEGERRFREMTRGWRTVAASLSTLLEGGRG